MQYIPLVTGKRRIQSWNLGEAQVNRNSDDRKEAVEMSGLSPITAACPIVTKSARGGSNKVFHQLAQRDPQNPGHQPQVEDRQVPFPTFNGADEGAVQLAALGQDGLGPAAGVP